MQRRYTFRAIIYTHLDVNDLTGFVRLTGNTATTTIARYDLNLGDCKECISRLSEANILVLNMSFDLELNPSD